MSIHFGTYAGGGYDDPYEPLPNYLQPTPSTNITYTGANYGTSSGGWQPDVQAMVAGLQGTFADYTATPARVPTPGRTPGGWQPDVQAFVTGLGETFADYGTQPSGVNEPYVQALSDPAAAAWAPIGALDYTAYGIDPEWITSPAQAFRTFGTGFRPGFERQAFYTQQPRLTQEYMLGMPAAPQSFGDFLRQYTVNPMAGADLRARARQIAGIQGMTQDQWMAYLAGQGPEGFTTGLSPIQDVTFRDWYGAGSQNELDLARTLALQRGAGSGVYQGVIGDAISNVMSDLHTQFVGENPSGNFLEWYLDRSAPGERLAF
jgi:hypothetical protein